MDNNTQELFTMIGQLYVEMSRTQVVINQLQTRLQAQDVELNELRVNVDQSLDTPEVRGGLTSTG